MQIEIKIPNRANLSLPVDQHDTILAIKEKIFDLSAIPVTDQKLYLSEEVDARSQSDLRTIQGRCNRSKNFPTTFQPYLPSMRRHSCGRQCSNVLHHPREALEDAKELREYHLLLRHGLTLCYCESMTVLFTTVEKSKYYPIEVKSEDLVGDIKSQLEKKFDFPKWQMIISYNGKILQNNRSLTSYNIPHKSQLSLGFEFNLKRNVKRRHEIKL